NSSRRSEDAMSQEVEVVLQAFRAVETRDREGLLSLYHREVEFVDAPSLPYGGTFRGKEDIRNRLDRAPNETWLGTWGPLQPTEAERSMDPRTVAANGPEAVLLYCQ